jgi:hypothetical protein
MFTHAFDARANDSVICFSFSLNCVDANSNSTSALAEVHGWSEDTNKLVVIIISAVFVVTSRLPLLPLLVVSFSSSSVIIIKSSSLFVAQKASPLLPSCCRPLRRRRIVLLDRNASALVVVFLLVPPSKEVECRQHERQQCIVKVVEIIDCILGVFDKKVQPFE